MVFPGVPADVAFNSVRNHRHIYILCRFVVWAAVVAGMGGMHFGWVTALLLRLPSASYRVFMCSDTCRSTQRTMS